MRRIAALACLVVTSACPAKKDDPAREKATPADEAPEPDPSRAKAVRPTTPPGVAPVAALSRADWPCASTLDSIGARHTYDYTDAPPTCSFPPDLWLPGCPTKHVQANEGVGLAIEVTYRYDDQHRLLAIGSKLALAAVPSIAYEGDKLVSQGDMTYHAVGATTQIWNADGTLYAVVDHAGGPGVRRLRTTLEGPDDPQPGTDEVYEYEGTRLARIRGKALGMEEIRAFEYDCK